MSHKLFYNSLLIDSTGSLVFFLAACSDFVFEESIIKRIIVRILSTIFVVEMHWPGLKSICVEFDPGSYVVNYGFIMLYVVDKYCLGFLHGKC